MSSQDRLTRQELSWLLAQEARGAAKALRDGVTQLKVPAPTIDLRDSMAPVETNLDALDDAIGMLSELQSGSHGKGRRGRLDVAALLCEMAPAARIGMDTGEGTEVFGEESEMRRMLHVLVSQSVPGESLEAATPEVSVRRVDSWVKISVGLGPDSSASAELERRWLSRMAVRHGGKVELEGGMQTLLLPADGAHDQREVAQLRKELEQAQQLGEAYARELAASFSAGDKPASVVPPSGEVDGGFQALVGGLGALARALRSLCEGFRADASGVSSALGDGSDLAQGLSKRVSVAYELLGELDRVAQCPLDEAPIKVDLAEVLRATADASGGRASRHAVRLTLEVAEGVSVQAPPATLAVLVRALIDHAIAATPRDGEVVGRVSVEGSNAVLRVIDGGPSVPVSARPELLRQRVDPRSLGRPSGVDLLVADAVAAHLRAPLTFDDVDGARSALKVTFRRV